jgi:signal transduction histidine kinase
MPRGNSDQIMRYVDLSDPAAQTAALTPYERRILGTINRKVAARESLEAVIDFLFESTQSICPCDRIGLAFLEEDGRRVVAHYARAQYEPLLLQRGYTEDLRGSSLQHVQELNSPRIINDLQRYAEKRPRRPSPKLLLREGVRSSLTCPLAVEGRVVGLLFRSSRRPHAYDDRQVVLHQAVAERLSQAVQKAYCIEQLRAANHAYCELLASVSHELAGPVACILRDARLLTDGYLGALSPNHRERIEQITTKGRYLANRISRYLNLARVESDTLKLGSRREVDFVAEVIDASVHVVRPQIESKGMALVCGLPPAPLYAECDPHLLRTVLVSLLENAVQYGREGSEIRLRTERNSQNLSVSVWNEGPGFPPNMRSRLFRRFSRLQTPELRRREGAGVALYTSWRIVQLHNGRIGANSERGRWAEFFFEIPQPLRS